jgi:MSHA pilin protein MshA
MVRTKGFTLIELVVVIVIIGILAVSVAPRFFNLQQDARAAILEAAAGNMRSALGLVYTRAVIEEQDGLSGSIDYSGTTVNVRNGYPAVVIQDYDLMAQEMRAWFDIDVEGYNDVVANPEISDFVMTRSTRMGMMILFFSEDVERVSMSYRCMLIYQNDPDQIGEEPTVTVFTDNC